MMRVKLPPTLQHPALWIMLFITWFITLWLLSSGDALRLPSNSVFQIDKVYHFGYFFGGGGLLCAALFTSTRGKIQAHHLLTWNVLILTATGALDEWHQSAVRGRFGNDAMDLMADFLGSVVAYYVFRRISHLLERSPISQD